MNIDKHLGLDVREKPEEDGDLNELDMEFFMEESVDELTDDDEEELDMLFDDVIAEHEDNYLLADSIDDAGRSIEDMENVRDSLSRHYENYPDSEFTDIAVESIKTNLRLIDRDFGINMNKTKGKPAMESYVEKTDLSVSERNKVALESIVDGIKGAWEKIKAGLKALWNSIKKFWKKHVSTLGRMKKKIRKYAKKISKVKGSPNLANEVKAGGGLSKTYPGSGDMKSSFLVSYLKRQITATQASTKATEAFAKAMEKLSKELFVFDREVEDEKGKTSELLKDNALQDFNVGSEQEPLVTGFYGSLEIEEEDDKLDVKFEKHEADINTGDDRKIFVGSTSDLTTLVTEIAKLWEVTEDLGRSFEKANEKFDRSLNSIERVVKDSPEAPNAAPGAKADKEDRGPKDESSASANQDRLEKDPVVNGENKTKAADAMTKRFRALSSVAPKINSKMSSLNLRAMRDGLKYIKLSLNNYTESGKK